MVRASCHCGSVNLGHIYVTLYSALQAAALDDLIPRNPASAVKPPRMDKREMSPLSPAQARVLLRHFKPLLRRAGLPDIRFHDLRHTCATLLLTKGVHPKIVSEMLGHSSVSITLDVYSHVVPGLGEAAAVVMEEALEE